MKIMKIMKDDDNNNDDEDDEVYEKLNLEMSIFTYFWVFSNNCIIKIYPCIKN